MRMRLISGLLPGLLIIAFSALQSLAEPLVVEDFSGDSAAKIVVNQSVEGSAAFKLEGDAKSGRWMSLQFTRGKLAGYAYVYLPITDRIAKNAADYDGITFKVKGDGSTTFGLIEVRADNYVNIYQAIFPLTSTEWTDVSLRWDEFLQMNDGAVDAPVNFRDLNKFAFGSRAQWGSCAYSVRDIALARIPLTAPICAPAGYDKLQRLVKCLATGQSVRIAALGDSITHGTKVPQEKRGGGLYFQVAADQIKAAFPTASVSTTNAGCAGDTVAEALVRVGHEVAPVKPQLVLVLLGANDAIYDFPESRERKALSKVIDELLITTDAEILILGPTPIMDRPGIPESYDELYAKIAAEKRVAYLNLTPALSLLSKEDYRRAFADNVHWSEYGHKVLGKAVADHILELAR